VKTVFFNFRQGFVNNSNEKYSNTLCRPNINFVKKNYCETILFTARRYTSTLYAMALCLSVSVTSRMAKCRITQTIPHDWA